MRSLLFLCALLMAPVTYAVTITVTADRDPAVLNESFVLTFESDDDVDDDPDFSPLNRDFQVLSTGESSNMSIINGRVSSSKTWTLNVMARRAGELLIPPVAFGSDLSTSAMINVVKDAPAGSTSNLREIFLEVAVNAEHPYVQSEVIYTIRLFRSVATANATLSEPDVSGVTAVVEKLGEDRSYETTRQGNLFGVIERKYAIYPQGSGRLTIGPMIFQGQITRGFNLFGNPFGRQPQTVSAQSESITLDVQAIPAAFKGSQWLPAREMSLMEEWSDYPLQFKIDEPLTRTLTLRATGLTASQLPELPVWTTDAFKQYPDQPVLEDDKQGDGVIGKRVEKIAMIPGRAGTYTLPEIS
ncbi:MAG: Protein BatD, partial [Gammaproteobacteria bacterium]|nr:Protein BatD [Gammaproteobacteria bacterium]